MMRALAVAVIATYDHLHAALNLVRSIRETWSMQPKVYVGLVDHPHRERPGFESLHDVEVVPATALGVPDFWWQAAKFSAAEFCCVLKPYLLSYVLGRGHDTVVYCDTDMQFFDDARALVEHAPHADLVLVPHMMSPFPRGFPDERPTTGDIGNAGMMNGGLLVARRRPSTSTFLDAWAKLCTAPGAFLPEHGYPSEQQALNWAFAYTSDVSIFRDPRFNIAFWNLHERPLRWSRLDGGREDEWTLDGRPIVCFHFSGLSWPEGRLSRHENRHHLSLNVNLWALCRDYHRRLLAAHAAHYSTVGYEYGEVEGRRLAPEVREELRRLEGFIIPVVESWTDVPVALREAARVIGRRSILPMYLERIRDVRADLQGLDGPEDVCLNGFLRWTDRWLRYEHPCATLHEYYMDTAFSIHHLDTLAGDIAGPLGLSWERAVEALTNDRPRLLDRLRRLSPRPDLLETIEAGVYRYPAFDPAICLRMIYESRPDLRQAYPDPLGSDLPAFRTWLQTFLPQEYIVPQRVRDFGFTLDPSASLVRLLSHTQSFDVLRSEVAARGLDTWAVPHFVRALPNAPGYETSDIVVVAWWLEKHRSEARRAVDRTFVPALTTPAAAAYLEWWCRRNIESLEGRSEVPVSSLSVSCAGEMRDFVAKLTTTLGRPGRDDRPASGEARTVERFVTACEAARMEMRRAEAREVLAPILRPDPLGINIFGYFKSPIGLGSASSGLVAAFHQAGYRTRRIVLANSTMDADLCPEDLYPDFGFNIPRNLVVTYPHIQHDLFAAFPSEFFEGRETSAYVAWEQRDLHPSWAETLKRYDRLFALSRFTAEAIAMGTGWPCEPIPCVVDVDHHARARWPRESFGIPPDKFVVGLVFDATSSIERKNPLAAVRAVGCAMDGRDVLLVIKVSSGHQARFSPSVRAIVDEARRYGLDHVLITEIMPKARVDALIASFDLYVSLHRSEGFGYTIAEAMMLGVPVVATGYSGNMDFMTVDNSYPVRCHEVVVRRQEGPFQLGTVWAEPDVDDAVDKCRLVYDKPARAKARAERARIDVEAVVSVKAVARRLQELFG